MHKKVYQKIFKTREEELIERETNRSSGGSFRWVPGIGIRRHKLVSLLSVHRFRLVVVALLRRRARSSSRPLRAPATALSVVVPAGGAGAAGARVLWCSRWWCVWRRCSFTFVVLVFVVVFVVVVVVVDHDDVAASHADGLRLLLRQLVVDVLLNLEIKLKFLSWLF